MSDRPTLGELSAQASGGQRIVCPKCGCAHFDDANGSRRRPSGFTYRYRYCRNCGQGIVVRQPPEEFVREVKPQNKLPANGKPALTVRRYAG